MEAHSILRPSARLPSSAYCRAGATCAPSVPCQPHATHSTTSKLAQSTARPVNTAGPAGGGAAKPRQKVTPAPPCRQLQGQGTEIVSLGSWSYADMLTRCVIGTIAHVLQLAAFTDRHSNRV